MESEDNPKEFPDVGQKLSAPKKLSQFEKDRQAAQAKQLRAEAENAAALKDFEDSFAGDRDEDDGFATYSGTRGPPSGPRASGMGYGSGRGFGMPMGGVRSGPGSLGEIPGFPPPSLKRKRELDEMREQREIRREQDDLMGHDHPQGRSPRVDAQDEERDIDAPRPTIQLSSLPPDMISDEVKALLREHLNVHSVRFSAPSGGGTNAKRSLSAIATLSFDATSSQIDTAITALKGKYVGRGFYMTASRHLSSAAFNPTTPSSTGHTAQEPFGAEKPRDGREQYSMRNAPPPMEQRGFAPPDSYETPSRLTQSGGRRNDAIVSVKPPMEIEAVKAVHTVVDRLLLEPDPGRAVQIEAMLMSLPEVQRDERFAFLYDAQCAAGIYYRFLLWAPDELNSAEKDNKRRDLSIERIHGDVPIEWHPPYAQVPFPDLKSLEHVVTDIDYMSSDEESDDDGADRQFNSGREGDTGEKDEAKHLSPLQRARFVHLLSRLPTSISRLRKGDVARITNFAINHAGAGADEVVDLLLLNIMKPFPYSLASRYEDAEEQDEEDVYEPDDDLTALDSPAPQASKISRRDDDPSNSKLIALYLISDILSASSTAGARNAWKYRQLFESGFKAQKTFEHLGKLDKELSWGRLKAEQWNRKIGVVFGIWESWSVFPSEVHEGFKNSFFEVPPSEEEKATARIEAEKEEKQNQESKLAGKFKRVEGTSDADQAAFPAPLATVPSAAVPEDVVDDADGTPMEDTVDGVPLVDDVDGQPMEDDVDGEPMKDNVNVHSQGELNGTTESASSTAPDPKDKISLTATAAKTPAKGSVPKKRMTAADMFGDSSDEG